MNLNFKILKEIQTENSKDKYNYPNHSFHPIIKFEFLQERKPDLLLILSNSEIKLIEGLEYLLDDIVENSQNSKEKFYKININTIHKPIINKFKVERNLLVVRNHDYTNLFIGFIDEAHEFILIDLYKKKLEKEENVKVYHNNDNNNNNISNKNKFIEYKFSEWFIKTIKKFKIKENSLYGFLNMELLNKNTIPMLYDNFYEFKKEYENEELKLMSLIK